MHTVNRQVSDGNSYIRLTELEFKRPKKVSKAYRMLDGDTGLVEALVFEVQDRELIGHVMDDGSRRFCCSEDLASKIRCKKDRVIVKVTRTQRSRPGDWGLARERAWVLGGERGDVGDGD